MRDLEERFANALQNAARGWRHAVDRRLKFLGMSQAGWMTIAVAARAGASLSQSELAHRLGVEGATLVAMIDRLVKGGLVLREPSTVDRRIKRVVVTAAGQRLYETVKAVAVEVRRDLLAQVDPGQLAVATEVLETLGGRFDTPP